MTDNTNAFMKFSGVSNNKTDKYSEKRSFVQFLSDLHFVKTLRNIKNRST